MVNNNKKIQMCIPLLREKKWHRLKRKHEVCLLYNTHSSVFKAFAYPGNSALLANKQCIVLSSMKYQTSNLCGK